MDFTKIKLKSINERKSKVFIKDFKDPKKDKKFIVNKELSELVNSIKTTKENNKEIILMMGAHSIKLGLSLYLIDLMKKNYITHIAMNGATSIHDFEITFIGETSEYVEETIKDGSFGMCKDTSYINEIINKGKEEGYGEILGKNLSNGTFIFEDYGLLSQAYKYDIPSTVHIAIGTDINHMYTNFNPEKVGRLTHNDFKKFTKKVSNLEGGVIMNLGSAVIMPEVFLKSLSIARNLGYKVKNFTAANFDMIEHYRPKVNVLERTTKGKKLNIIERHEDSIPTLHYLLTK